MEFENLKKDFPRMPEEMRVMVEKEVEKQIKKEHTPNKGRKAAGKALAASIAVAVILCATTTFAGPALYQMHQQKLGAHGLRISIENTEGASGNKIEEPVTDYTHTDMAKSNTDAENKTGTNTATIPNVKLEVGYIPAGMVEYKLGCYSFASTMARGGVHMEFYRMDTGDEKFESLQEDVLSSENFTANGLQGIYLEYPHLYQDEIKFNQRIYVAFTDVHYVMEMYIASDVTKEDAIKIAKSVKLLPAKDTGDDVIVSAMNWSVYQQRQIGLAQEEQRLAENPITPPTVSKEKMERATHAVGESFPLKKRLTAKISDVKISDSLSLLNPLYIEEDLKNEADDNGMLLPATIQYIKRGTLDSLSEVVKSREAPQKLVYATVEYTNTGKKEMKDLLFCADIFSIRENNGQMQIIRDEDQIPGNGETWQQALNHGLSDDWEMQYYDVRGGEEHDNYIPYIKPGETVTVHIAWVVKEEDLDSLYVNLDCIGYNFVDSCLKIGYVDIRQ